MKTGVRKDTMCGKSCVGDYCSKHKNTKTALKEEEQKVVDAIQVTLKKDPDFLYKKLCLIAKPLIQGLFRETYREKLAEFRMKLDVNIEGAPVITTIDGRKFCFDVFEITDDVNPTEPSNHPESDPDKHSESEDSSEGKSQSHST